MTGIGTPTTSSLIRVGTDGLAFETSNNQLVIVRSVLVPEPSSQALAVVGVVLLMNWRSLRRAFRKRGGAALRDVSA